MVGIGTVLLLAGCTPMQWVKEDAPPAQVSADAAHCQQEAWREAQFRAWAYRPFAPILLRDPAGRPYVAWNSPLYDPFGDRFMEESRLAQFCMRAKGYRLEAVEQPKKPQAETIQPSPEKPSGGKP
jgi:hypothetical protein